MLNTEELQQRIAGFAQERDWVQFHTPKNLVMALSVESSELLEIFQWLTPAEASTIMSSAKADQVRHEMADVAVYLLRLADVLGVNLTDAIHEKLKLNAEKYPVEKAKGNARKYDEL